MSKKSRNEIVREFNKLSLELSQSEQEIDDECAGLEMEISPAKQIRLSWDVWSGPQVGWTEQHKYITVKEAEEELNKLKSNIDDCK